MIVYIILSHIQKEILIKLKIDMLHTSPVQLIYVLYISSNKIGV